MNPAKRLRRRLAKGRGTAARLTGYLPASVQVRLARLIGYTHDYDGLDSHLRLLLAVRNLEGSSSLISQDTARSRRQFRAEMASIVGRPTPVGRVKNFSIDGSAGKIPVRHYQPKQGQSHQAESTPLLVFYHGGGFVVGDLDTHDEACRLLCQHGAMQVLSVDYRLAPENPAPAAVEDSIAALKWAKANAASLGADPQKIAVGGDSAGGNLAAVVSQQTKQSDAAPAAQLLIYPVVDLVNEYESRKTLIQGLFLSDLEIAEANAAYVGTSELDLQNPLVTPLLGDLSDLPPAFIVTAEFDALRDEGEVYAQRMLDSGSHAVLKRTQGQGHGFINVTPINRAAKQETINMAKDFRQLLNSL